MQIVAAGGFEASLDMSATQVGLAGTVYLLGEVAGALIFGRLTDSLGRKKMFTLTLGVYLVGAALAGLSPNMWWFLVCRFISGMGIGGEYSAVNSAIDELIPGKHRGRVDLAINGTYWAGAALGAAASAFLLDTDRFAENIGWRIAFFIGPVLGLGIIFLRRLHPREPSLDADARPGRRGGGDRLQDRAGGPGRRSGAAPPRRLRRALDQGRQGTERQAAALRLLQALPDAHGARA